MAFRKDFLAVQCELTNKIFTKDDVRKNGCKYHNVDLSQEKICFNCKCFLGGSDWGLACAKHYHRLPNALSKACEEFDSKN